MAGEKKKLVLVDGYNMLFRAFFAIGPLTAPDGTPTNALLGFCRMLLKAIRDLDPTHLAVVMDAGGKSFRSEMYAEYKANRPSAPEELKAQFPLARQLVELLGIPLLEKEGVEADDVIGTLAKRAERDGYDVVIVSGDKDLMQLVTDRVKMLDTMKDVLYGPKEVERKLGVPPEKVADLLGLQGDSSDNIPGVTKVGPKTARKLLAEHGDLEGVLRAAPGMKKSKLKERLVEEADRARLSKRLATIVTDLELDLEPGQLVRRPSERKLLDDLLARLGFSRLRRELTAEAVVDRSGYRIIRDLEELERFFEDCRRARCIAVDLETTSLDPMEADIVGFALCCREGEAVYVPVAHRGPGAGEQLDASEVLKRLDGLLQEDGISLYGQNLKYDALILLNRHGLELPAPACDSMVASYVLDPGRSSHSLDALALEFLGHRTIGYEEVAGKGKQQVSFAKVPVERAAEYAAEDADITLRLCLLLGRMVEQEGLDEVLHRLELPLVPVLVRMEHNGVGIDTGLLERLGDHVDGQLGRLEREIYELAGSEFNLNSPVQLRKVLFDDLGLPVVKKTRTGPSTDQSVLEQLAASHPIAERLLEYRSLAKLKSTYIDVLPRMVNPATGRIHTRYNQTVTATGRLSSSDPNLQNIPVRTELGRRIREAFVAPRGHRLLSADYSQIELRILAHLTGDGNLIEAFERGEDIHAATAARIHGVAVEDVTAEMRYGAKAVNFGIVYGQGPYNLARQLGIERREAKRIIDTYFEMYPGVRAWIERVHEQARKDGYVTTMFGRRRKLPEISSTDRVARANAERIAQNTPIQGTAADIIKLAMIDLHGEMLRRGLRSRMVLQVHDELVFEVPKAELDLMRELAREKMEGAVQLNVPLVVDVADGRTWAEAHP